MSWLTVVGAFFGLFAFVLVLVAVVVCFGVGLFCSVCCVLGLCLWLLVCLVCMLAWFMCVSVLFTCGLGGLVDVCLRRLLWFMFICLLVCGLCCWFTDLVVCWCLVCCCVFTLLFMVIFLVAALVCFVIGG